MRDHLFALLIHNRPEPFESLRGVLKDLSIETYSVETCKEAKDLISQCKPHVVFTERALVDGSWVSILTMAEEADVPVSVIVVGALPSDQLHVSVTERGAFDFVAPPFECEPLNSVVRSAALAAHCRREASASRVSA